jgi:hypothetical protein
MRGKKIIEISFKMWCIGELLIINFCDKDWCQYNNLREKW